MAVLELQFRAATTDDASQIQQLVQSAFRTEDSRPDWTGLVELASGFSIGVEEVRDKINKPESVVLIAVAKEDSLVASIEVTRREANTGRISMVAVDDRYQRDGVGRRVLEYAEDYCRRVWNVERFSLNALSTRKALIDWYIRRGYRKTGEESPFPREKFGDHAMPADICFVEMEKDLGHDVDSHAPK